MHTERSCQIQIQGFSASKFYYYLSYFLLCQKQSDFLKENKQGFVLSELVVGFSEQDTDHKFSQQ